MTRSPIRPNMLGATSASGLGVPFAEVLIHKPKPIPGGGSGSENTGTAVALKSGINIGCNFQSENVTRNVNPNRPFFTLTGAILLLNSSLFYAELRHNISNIGPVSHKPAVRRSGLYISLGFSSSARVLQKSSYPFAAAACAVAVLKLNFINFPRPGRRVMSVVPEWVFSSSLTPPCGAHRIGTVAAFRTGKAGVSKNFHKFPVSKDYSARPFSIPSLGFRSYSCTSAVNSFVFSAWPRPSYPLASVSAAEPNFSCKVSSFPSPMQWTCASTVPGAGFLGFTSSAAGGAFDIRTDAVHTLNSSSVKLRHIAASVHFASPVCLAATVLQNGPTYRKRQRLQPWSGIHFSGRAAWPYKSGKLHPLTLRRPVLFCLVPVRSTTIFYQSFAGERIGTGAEAHNLLPLIWVGVNPPWIRPAGFAVFPLIFQISRML